MAVQHWLFAVLFGFALASSAAAADAGLHNDLVKAGFKRFAEVVHSCPLMMEAIKESGHPSWKCTILAPSDAAVDAWLKEINLTIPELALRPNLAAMVVGYHLILEETLDLKKALGINNTIVANTGCPVWNITLNNKNGIVTATDAQKRTGTVDINKKVTSASRIFYPINKVLMNGDYFFTIDAALTFFPKQLGALKRAIDKVPSLKAAAAKPSTAVTLLTPMSKAFQVAKVDIASTPSATLERVLSYHILTGPIKAIPLNVTSGKSYPTALSGATVKIVFDTPKLKPVVAGSNHQILRASAYVYPASGQKVLVISPNMFAGKSIIHVINTVMLPGGGAGAKTASQSGLGQTPTYATTAGTTGRKLHQGGRNDRGFRSQLSIAATSARILAATQGGSVTSATTAGLRSAQAVSYTDNNDLFFSGSLL